MHFLNISLVVLVNGVAKLLSCFNSFVLMFSFLFFFCPDLQGLFSGQCS